MNYFLDGNPDSERIDQAIIEWLATCMNGEHQYYLQDVPIKHQITLMHELMERHGYGKFVPKTLADVIKLEEFNL